MGERPMIIGVSTTRSQQRYDHRLRDLVHRTGDISLATELGVPRSTARGWLGAAPRPVVRLDVAHLTERELREEILKPDLLRLYPGPRAEDLASAWAYMRSHSDEIDR